MITSLLFILLWSLVALLILALVIYIVGMFIPIPANVVKLLYAIVGVLVIIQLVQLFLGGPVWIRLPR